MRSNLNISFPRVLCVSAVRFFDRVSKFCLLALVALSVVQLSALAQETPTLQFSGFLRAENITYFKGFDPAIADNGRNQIKFLLKVQSDLSSVLKMSSSVEFRHDEVNPSRNRTTIKEAFIEYSINNLDVRAGKQIYAWGRADEINPTNNISPVDYSDFLDTDDEKIGVISLSSRYYWDAVTLELITAPTLVPNVLPAVDSRWNLFPASIGSMQVHKPTNEFKNWQRAIRISLSYGGWDISASYFHAFDAFPWVFFQPNSATGLLDVTLDYRKLQVVGADFATAFDKLGFRGEAGYFLTGDTDGRVPEISDPYLRYVIGVDYTMKDLVGEQDLFLLAQWVQDVQLPTRAGGEFLDNDLRHLFQRTVMLKTEWRFSEFSRVIIQGFWRVRAEDFYLQPKFSADITDGLNLELGADILAGKSGSLFDQLRNNRRAFGNVTYRF